MGYSIRFEEVATQVTPALPYVLLHERTGEDSHEDQVLDRRSTAQADDGRSVVTEIQVRHIDR